MEHNNQDGLLWYVFLIDVLLFLCGLSRLAILLNLFFIIYLLFFRNREINNKYDEKEILEDAQKDFEDVEKIIRNLGPKAITEEQYLLIWGQLQDLKVNFAQTKNYMKVHEYKEAFEELLNKTIELIDYLHDNKQVLVK